MGKKLILFFIFFINACPSHCQLGNCLDEDSLLSNYALLKRKISNDQQLRFCIEDSVLFERVYSFDMVKHIFAELKKFSFISQPCDSIKEMRLIYCYQNQHKEEYLYLVIKDQYNKYHYYTNNNGTYDKIGTVKDFDYLYFVSNQLFSMRSPPFNDLLIIASIEDLKLVTYKATNRFNILDHFQIIAAVEELIRYANR